VSRTKLEDVADEVRAQPGILAKFAKSKLEKVPVGSIFVGAGDSYAAAMAGFYASNGRCLALDPYSLWASPEAASGRDVVFVSASGRTSSNVAAAKRVKGTARRTWVVTADEGSRLAEVADETVRVPMEYVPRTPGMLSFSLSLLVVLRMSAGLGACDFRSAFRRANGQSGIVTFGRGTTYFLGNSAAFAVSLYAAAKGYELLGAKCHAELLEEFSHKEVFSLRSADAVNVFGCFDPAGAGGKLCRLLADGGHIARLIPRSGAGSMENLFRSIFVVQLATLKEASARKLTEPRFLSSRGNLAISDRMIY
jgi:hypothetical protein